MGDQKVAVLVAADGFVMEQLADHCGVAAGGADAAAGAVVAAIVKCAAAPHPERATARATPAICARVLMSASRLPLPAGIAPPERGGERVLAHTPTSRVFVAWIASIAGLTADGVDTVLPPDDTTWQANGFIVVPGTVGGTPHAPMPLRRQAGHVQS